MGDYKFLYDPELEGDPDWEILKAQLSGEEDILDKYNHAGSAPTAEQSSVVEIPARNQVSPAVPILETPSTERTGVVPQSPPNVDALKTSVLDDLVKKRLQAEADANTESELTGGQALATGLSALIPTVLGALWAKRRGVGALQGAAAGAEAGGAGAAVGLKGYAADQERARKLASTRASLLGRMEQDERKNIFALNKQEDQQTFTAGQDSLKMDAAMKRAKLFQRGGSTNGLDVPLSAEQNAVAEKLIKGEYVSPEEKTKAGFTPRMEGIVLGNKSIDTRQESLQLRQNQWGRLVDSIERNPSLEVLPGASPMKGDLERSEPVVAKLAVANRALIEYKDALKKRLPTSELDSYRANVILKMKDLEGMGANFTNLEAGLLTNQLPYNFTLSDPNASILLQRAFSKFDNENMIDRVLDSTNYAALELLKARGFKPRGYDVAEYDRILGGVRRYANVVKTAPKREDYAGDTAAFVAATRKWLAENPRN